MPSFQKINTWIDRYLYQPELTQEAKIRKKIYFLWTVGGFICVVGLTLLAILIRLWSILWFGVVLGILYCHMPLYGTRYYFDKLPLVWTYTAYFATYIAILKFGGITNSLGLVFIGLTLVMVTVPYGKVRMTVHAFIIYALSIVFAALIQPYLKVPPEITPSINLLYHVLNIIWISAMITVFLVYYITRSSNFQKERAEKLRELNEAKTKLYTNITHEFRTPLTIMLGMANQVRENPKEWFSNGLELINRNGRILLNLVNQMLDLQKIEAGLMIAHFIQSDIIPFITSMSQFFSSTAKSQQIELEFRTELVKLVMDFDPNKMQNVLSNLISNALKFTLPGGKVLIEARLESPPATENHAHLILTVTDTGIGIPEKNLPHIFERFYQVEDAAAKEIGGTGIGLALTRELVHLMNGNISVQSQVGKGTVFTVKLPITHLAEIEISPPEYSSENLAIQLSTPVLEEANTASVDNQDYKPILLIVEDNADMMRYLSACLHEGYQLHLARNGKTGQEKALEHIPDIIITDVMMPEMDGIEMCTLLKNDVRTSHIPIVMLTAKADITSRIEGFESGADAYQTKPFYKEELLLQLRNLLALRKKIQQRYTAFETLPPAENVAIEREDAFIQLVRTVVENHLSDEEFSIKSLCQELLMSRAQLYRKFEALTDCPIGKFIRTMRLHKAKELLRNAGYNVTEAAYAVGFRNLSHFSTAFKEEFGVSPSETHS